MGADGALHGARDLGDQTVDAVGECVGGAAGIPVEDEVRRCSIARVSPVRMPERGGRLRLSPHCYNSFEEVDRAVERLWSPV